MKIRINVALLLFLTSGCARSYLVKTDQTRLAVNKVNILGVRYYRPDFQPSEHDDFKSKDRELKCETAQDLWKDVLKVQTAARDCLNSIGEAKAVYLYVPEAQPYLELDPDEEKNPLCLKTALPKIPLPREVYFMGMRHEPLKDNTQECFSSSFSTKTNQLMMTDTKFLKKKIAIPFPMARQLKNVRDLEMWLMVSVFTILKSDDDADQWLWASPVPEFTCRACFKNDAFFEAKISGKMKPVFWP